MPATTGRKRGRIAPAPRLSPLAVRSAALGDTTRGGGLRHHLAVDHRQAVAGLLVHADGLLRALVAVGHVVAHGLVLRAQRDAAAGLAAHAHRVGAAIRGAIGHVVADHVAGLGRVGDGVALALGAVHPLAVGPRRAVAGLLVHADGLRRALVAVGHVVAHGLVRRAQRDAAAGLAAHAHRVGAAIRGAIGHVVADHVAGLGRVGDGVALALGAVHHLAADVLAVDAVADIAAGHGAGRGRDLLAAAAADLVADQATDDRTGHGAADVAVRSEEHTSELQSLMRISYAVFCLKKKKHTRRKNKEKKKNLTNHKKTNTNKNN